jgi:site-specific DNA-methyltransferase (adenine-specific)
MKTTRFINPQFTIRNWKIRNRMEFMTQYLDSYLDRIILGDCREHLEKLPPESVHLCLSDIPYGISLAEWDVLHANRNSALLGQSPAQQGKAGFRRRGKPINGWSSADRDISREYQSWCREWTDPLFGVMKEGASVMIFGARRTLHRAIVAFEESGFLLRDILAWEKPGAHHRAQSLENLMRKRGLDDEAERWQGWRVGNLAPIWEPVAWFFKPYRHTILDNVLEHEVGAMNVDACRVNGTSPTNVLRFDNGPDERLHETQKPLELMRYLIRLTTREGQTVLDPFIGSGTTAVAARSLNRRYIGFEIREDHWRVAQARIAKEEATTEGTALKGSV